MTPEPRSRPERRVEIDYTNWRGERRARHIEPIAVAWGTCPPWHPAEGWYLDAFDVDLGAFRTFALTGIHSWRPDAAFGVKVIVDPTVPDDEIRVEHPDGRVDTYKVAATPSGQPGAREKGEGSK
jgi:predicted DNA-binding transcriptional regulator YafY